MATTTVKSRRGTTAQHAAFTGAIGEVTVDTTKSTVVVHDGILAGGYPLAKEVGGTFTGGTVSGGTDIDMGSLATGGTLDLRRGTTAQHSTFTGADGEVTFNTDTNALVTHDGATAGGFPHTVSSTLSASAGAALIGWISSGAGAVATTVQTALRERVSATWFGAAPGASAATNSAALAAAVVHLSGGGVIDLIPGTFNINTKLTLASAVTLNGSGMDTTILNYTGADTAVSVQGLTKCQIQNMGIVATGAASYVVNMDGATLCTLQNVNARGAVVGVYNKQGNENLFLQVAANSCTQDGFYFDYDANNCTLVGCEAVGNTRAGLYTLGPRQLALYSCALEANGYGAYVTTTATGTRRTAGLLLSNCYIEGNATNEVYIITGGGSLKPRGISIKDCYFVYIATKATVAIRVEDVDGLEIDGNTFDDVGGLYSYSTYVNNAGSATGVVWGFNTDKSTNGFLSIAPPAGITNLPSVVSTVSATEELAPKAWGRFTVSGGAIATTNLQGVTSVTYVSTGVYEVTLSTAQSGTDYCITASAENGASLTGLICSPSQPISTTVFRLITVRPSTETVFDARTVSFIVNS